MTLAEQFTHWWLRMGGTVESAVTNYIKISRRYSEKHRHYHRLRPHIAHCLRELKAVRSICAHPDEVEGALWFHDVDYETSPGAVSERRSAEFLNELLRPIGVSDAARIRMMDHVMATDHKTPPKSFDSQLVVDIDLAILGQPWERYRAYTQQIRREWKHVSEELYRPGRSQVLQKFLDRANIYHTRDFRLKYEKAARTNLAREIKALAR